MATPITNQTIILLALDVNVGHFLGRQCLYSAQKEKTRMNEKQKQKTIASTICTLVELFVTTSVYKQ